VSPSYKEFQRDLIEDSRSAKYPGVLNVLRGNYNVNLAPQTKLHSYSFLQKDIRFQDKDQPITRPQVFYYTVKMLEPTYFGPLSNRPWVLLLSDVDVHAWTPISAFSLLCAKMELLLKVPCL
jgi:hypothetical protein